MNALEFSVLGPDVTGFVLESIKWIENKYAVVPIDSTGLL